MKEITLRVPENKLDFIMELLEQLNIEVTDDHEIPEEHKRIVLERMQKSKENPERLIPWEEVKDKFDLD